MVLEYILRAIQVLATNQEVRQSAMEAFADAAAELWPEGPPLPEDMDDAQFLRVINRAIENIG